MKLSQQKILRIIKFKEKRMYQTRPPEQSKTSPSEKQKKKELIQKFISNLSEEQKLKFWIKTLLSAHGTIPEVIKTLDKIIELQASSVSFAADIYNQDKSTINQVERVINLSERKNFLLNIYIMSKDLLKGLNESDIDFLQKKYMFNWSAEELAREMDISVRTVYRRIDKLIDTIYFKLKSKNWSLRFLESQIRNEFWLKEKFNKQVADYFKNTNYSKSSSESYMGNLG